MEQTELDLIDDGCIEVSSGAELEGEAFTAHIVAVIESQLRVYALRD